jgi:hypothetical protein
VPPTPTQVFLPVLLMKYTTASPTFYRKFMYYVENQGLYPPLLSGDVIFRVLRELELSKNQYNQAFSSIY